MAPVLNLNNEVVKMRKEVKKIRVLSIRKLTRHLAKLKSKKGTKEDILRNQRRAQRLLEEIHAMKEVKPDDVTKTALQKDINFEKVCRMNGSSAEERAIARLATHPQFKKRIDDIKAAVKAFKEERLNPSKVQPSEECQSEKEEKPVQSLQVDVEITEPVGTRQKNTTTKQKPIHGRDGKKRDTKVHLTPLPKGSIGNENIASQKEETSMVIDSNENVSVSLKEDVPSSPGNSNPSAPQEKMHAALTIDSPDAPVENIPDASTEDTSATQGENVPAAQFKSMTVIPKPDIPATPKEDTPITPKEDVPSFAEGEDIDKEGTSFLSKANMAASTVDEISIISKDVLSISQKQKDKLYAKQTKNVSISKKGKSFSVQCKLDKSKVMDSDSSDMEESENEDREYFDDSTEERFLRQSSGPDDSDSEDDFFLGKVKQTKKRKGTNPHSAEKARDLELSKVSEKEPLTMDSKVLSSGTHKANTKLQKLESVFCRSLAQSKPKATLTKRNIKDPPEIKKKAEFQRNKPHVMKHQRGNELTVKQDEKKLHSAKQDNKKQKFHNVKQERKIQQLQQPLHPSWEASKKRKEQQSQITAFQGKKIRFDD